MLGYKRRGYKHRPYLEAHSFPQASLSENSSLLGTDNVRRQMSEYIFRAKWRLLFMYGTELKNWSQNIFFGRFLRSKLKLGDNSFKRAVHACVTERVETELTR